MSLHVELAAVHTLRDPRRAKVLVVEDEAVVARDLERSLIDLGYEVTGSVASSDEALLSAEQERPDVVLLDIRIRGELDGIQTAESLRQRFRVPVVYLTAYSDDETLSRAARTEPYGYIVKPFTTREVRSAVEIACYKHAMDAQLSARERWFSTTLRSLGEAVIACTLDLRVHFMNAAAEELTGWTEAEAKGRQIDEVVQIAVQGRPFSCADLIAEVLTTRSVQTIAAHALLTRRGGHETRVVDDTAAPIVCDDALLGAVLVMRDMTAQRTLEDKLVISERLSSLGILAAGICHEINNPLTFIVANVHVLESAIAGWRQQLRSQGTIDLEDRTLQAEEALADLRQGAERIRRIVADLGAFGRPIEEPRSAIDVREAVEWSLRVVAAQLRSRARVVKELRPVPAVRASDTKLVQVLINLLVNAAHAIPEGDAERNTVRVTTDVDAQGRVVIAVQDSGTGIPQEVLPRIFDPFFTTKHPGLGSGLGLSICHGIVQSFGGELLAHSEVDRGSVFTVVLPPAAPLTPTADAGESCARESLRGRLLVVDDEVGVLRAAKALLGEDHDVVTSTDAREALAILQREPPFDLVLCDVMMDGWNGMDLYECVCQRLPAVASRFVFATGGAFTPRTRGFLQEFPSARVLHKPFDLGMLKKLLQVALHERLTKERGASK